MEKMAETAVKIVIVETASGTGESSRRSIAENARPDANDQRGKISAERGEEDGWREKLRIGRTSLEIILFSVRR